MPSQNVLPLDRQPENRFAGLGPDDLDEREVNSLLDLALEVLAHRHRGGESLTSPGATRAYLRLKLTQRKYEVFGCVFCRIESALRHILPPAGTHVSAGRCVSGIT